MQWFSSQRKMSLTHRFRERGVCMDKGCDIEGFSLPVED
jgi:hypothetical protein